jgi:DNA/RNA endonuclease YhcR with UshA esterase domain
MKFFSLMLVLLAAALSVNVANSAATYNNTVNGSQTAAPESEGIALNLTATGDLPGMSKLTLVRSEANVSGGTWTMTVLPANADADSTERGSLTGTVTGGTVTLNENGTLASGSAIQVSIQSGTGEFASVMSGSATINLSANAENPSQLNGTLVLNF